MFILLLGLGCTSPEKTLDKQIEEYNRKNSASFSCNQPFDTLAYLESLNLRNEVNELNQRDTVLLDTFTLKYIVFACYCPNWVLLDDLQGLNGYYLNPVAPNLVLPEGLRSGTVVTFIGKSGWRGAAYEYLEGNELTYYYYKIHKPYHLFGEQCFDGLHINAFDEIDSILRTREITVY